jgi:hypothetical protein
MTLQEMHTDDRVADLRTLDRMLQYMSKEYARLDEQLAAVLCIMARDAATRRETKYLEARACDNKRLN